LSVFNAPALNLAAGETPYTNGNQNYGGAYNSILNAASYRIVSCCLKLTFTGNISNNQGQVGGAYVGEPANAVAPKITY
jgi:hypothetical protein